MTNELDQLLNADLVANLDALSLEDVRARRDRCQGAEAALSYLRRVIQGRLDIVAAALAAQTKGDQFDAAALVQRLPEILADEARSYSPIIRPEGMVEAEVGGDEYVAGFVTELNGVIDMSSIDTVVAASKDELQQSVDALSELERKVSGSRRTIQEHLDALQAEIVRRYKTGEASVDTLLS